MFTSRSVLQGTKISYDSSLKVWNDYIAIKHAGVVDEFMINLSIDEKQLIIVGFLSYMYQKGYRGGKIKRHLNGVKQSFNLQAHSISAFNSDFVKQAIKGGRFDNQERRLATEVIRSNHQLPFTMDMVDQLEITYWQPGKWNKK